MMGGMGTSVSVCPSALVEAPIERVWDVLTSPVGLDAWADASLVWADPPGPARPGQRLRLTTPAFGRTFPVGIDVLEVDADRHRLHFLVDLPLGLVNDETVTMTDTGDTRTLVRFG
jgi:uncharacterized protein YndB with AHSA1/START domain